MQIIKSHVHGHRALATSTGERITEEQIVQSLLASGSFVNRPSVEREVSALFDSLEQR